MVIQVVCWGRHNTRGDIIDKIQSVNEQSTDECNHFTDGITVGEYHNRMVVEWVTSMERESSDDIIDGKGL